MREILFRAKHEDTGKWIYGDLIHEPFGTCIQYLDNGKRIKSKINENTICQYTGLTDKNGNRIWENDIVKVPMHRGGKTVVSIGFIEWLNGAFSVTWKDKEYGRHFVGYVEEISIIGNVFDNPDLLEGEHD